MSCVRPPCWSRSGATGGVQVSSNKTGTCPEGVYPGLTQATLQDSARLRNTAADQQLTAVKVERPGVNCH